MSDRSVKIGNPTTDDLARQMETLKSDLAQLTELMGDLGKAKGQEMRAKAEFKAQELRHEAENQLGELEAYVSRNPLQAMGIAAGIGLLIGFMGRR
ncbi:DUF883 family protein [Palleronia caenipelagi]|uniref:DUF883 domain-containing protein n=1 Tax=Palleronia caenipelagi TaxID=2489174 RepID=A0A547Q5N4_9RHOB|nr:DUF883 family protein [Palleronia caenipelagi]TRD21679.1 DUF883 domain-containing protein [Palleronia caenipelagi]